MKVFSSPKDAANEVTATLQRTGSSVGVCPLQPCSGVGLSAQREIPQSVVEQELDDVISELLQKMVGAAALGDKVGARLYLERANAMRSSRTPEHQARLDAEDAERADQLTFGGNWPTEILRRTGLYWDVPASAVRRRTAR